MNRSNFVSLDKFISSLPWHMRLRLWVAGFKFRRDLRSGRMKVTSHTLCFDCLHPIIEADDDACVCIQCGGRNRRAAHSAGKVQP